MEQPESEKRAMIENQLAEGFRDINNPMSPNELVSVLDKKHQRGQFSRDLYDQLTNQLSNMGMPLTIKNFTEVWLRAEENLKRTEEANLNEIQQMKNERDDFIQKKIEMEDKEVRNANKIMQNSELTVFIHNIENICKRDGNPFTANFILQCEGQQVETGLCMNPEFYEINKEFKFNIKTGQSPLEIIMVDGVDMNEESVEGVISVPLFELKDQKKVNVTLQFLDPNGRNEMPTSITMDLTWIYSMVKLYSDSISNLEHEITEKEAEIDDVKNYLFELYSPFPLLRKQAPVQTDVKTKVEGFFNPNVAAAREKQFARLPASNSPLTLLLMTAYIYLLIALMTSFNRCVFMDLLVSFLLFSAMQLNIPLFSKGFAYKAIGGIIVAIIIDSVWLAFYTKPWWNTGYEDSYSLLYVRRSMVVFSYTLMVIRLITVIIIFFTTKELPESKDEFDLKMAETKNTNSEFGSEIRGFAGF